MNEADLRSKGFVPDGQGGWSKPKACNPSSRPEPEPAVCNEPVAATQRKESDAKRILVRVTSFRRRLCDPDNLCPKYFIDCLRYANLIPNDSDQDIQLTVGQKQVETKEEEKTLIEITATMSNEHNPKVERARLKITEQ